MCLTFVIRIKCKVKYIKSGIYVKVKYFKYIIKFADYIILYKLLPQFTRNYVQFYDIAKFCKTSY